MFQLFACKQSEFKFLKLMRAKSQAANALWDVSREIGTLAILIKDGAKEMQGDEWDCAVCALCIEEHTSEAHHQNKNEAERQGGDVKLALLRFYYNTPTTPLSYW